MLAKTTWNPIKKMSYVMKGSLLMDTAVEKAPDDISVRMTRAYNSRNLPAFLNGGHLALEDYEHLVSLIGKGLIPDSLLKKKIYSNLAELYAEKGDGNAAENYRRLADKK